MPPSPMHRAPATAALLLAAAACGDLSVDRAGDMPARATFIEAYVDLRVAALRTPEEEISDSARAAILERHGVTEEDLVQFVDATAGDLDFTRDLWNEIEMRLDSVPPMPVDSVPAAAPPVDTLASESEAPGREARFGDASAEDRLP